MRRPSFVMLIALAVVAGAFTFCYLAGTRMHGHTGAAAGDDLSWLRQEFRLGEPEMQRIRTLHQSYLPECATMCQRIAAKNRELAEALSVSTNVTPAIELKLAEVATLRATCQAQMLRHFYQVSQAMPVEQGHRYLAEMRRLTLGLAGEPMAMPGAPADRHVQP